VFKNKMYVNGLGVGLIVGAILLQLMIVSKEASSKFSASGTMASVQPQTSAQTASSADVDLQKLKAEAAKSFQVFDKNVKLYTQAELDVELQKKLKEEKDKSALASPASNKRTYIYIQPNLPASSVAELLYRAEIVTDRRALEEELVKQNAVNKMQVGFHVFEGAQNMQQVIKNLTTEQ
jgi:hypothetical protein